MTWMLVDGNNWFARDWHATKDSPKPNVTEQFVKRLMVIKHQFQFDRAVVAWDSPNSFRKQLFPTYKSNRDGKSDDFVAALRKVQADAPNSVECLQADGFEADDILATLTHIAHHEGERVVLFSSDKDLYQLLRKDTVTQATQFERAAVNRYGLKFMNSDKLLAKFKVKPHQWVDYRVIVGDPSDGIPGVKDLGPSVAEKVLSRLSCLDRFYHAPFSVPDLSGRQRTLLLNSRPQWADLRRVLTLRTDVPIPASWFAALHGAQA